MSRPTNYIRVGGLCWILSCKRPKALGVVSGARDRWRCLWCDEFIDGIPVFVPLTDGEGSSTFPTRHDATERFYAEINDESDTLTPIE